MVIIPLFNIILWNVEYNKQIMKIMSNTLNSMDVKTSLVISTKTLSLTVKGIDNIFKSLLPLLEEYSHFLYWKMDSFDLLVWVKKVG